MQYKLGGLGTRLDSPKFVAGANTIAEYAYDGAKRRTVVKSYVSGSLDETRHFYFTEPSKWQVIEERVDSSSNAERQHVWGLRYIDDLVLRDRDTNGNGTLDERLYALQDANWNVTALSNASGAVQERFAYLPYGESTELNPDFTAYSGADIAWNVRFTGRELDITVGLQINRNRYLHLQIGHWVSRDSFDDGTSLNLYEYSDSRPTSAIDSSGNVAIAIPVGLIFLGVVLVALFVIVLLVAFRDAPKCKFELRIPRIWPKAQGARNGSGPSPHQKSQM